MHLNENILEKNGFYTNLNNQNIFTNYSEYKLSYFLILKSPLIHHQEKQEDINFNSQLNSLIKSSEKVLEKNDYRKNLEEITLEDFAISFANLNDVIDKKTIQKLN